ncbi:AGC family protein kinase [Histomonas meleagridis]|uniref:AGC family protein kinase n=1 Tax=Histomonas meleagridis TaxID=135588 RepID=UPI00355A77A8|nr:AGC family protein kinase [Histomonas meleagridis]KAH0805345.1 AGC family protein kinase [Histomonas meleagridis]
MENYHLLDQIGEGSFGRVYKARRKFTGNIVAIKMINKLGQSKEDLLSFRSEISILKKVNHPNVMRLLDIFETNTDFCIVSELARGDLFQIIDDGQTLPEEVLRSIAAQLVSALSNLHSSRIIHRDIKPQNVLVCANGALKFCDFGFARALSCTTLVLTSIKGTPLYMAPELVQEQPYDEKVDIWSLGVILYELYYGKPPFYTNSIYKLIQMIVNENIVWPETISEQFQDFLNKMLQKDPNKRASCEDLLMHPFIARVPLAPFDDSFYQYKRKQFDDAIEESLSSNFKPPEASTPDYQSILLNPSSYSTNDLLDAVKYVGEKDINLGSSQLSASFAYHFSEYIKNYSILEEVLKTATKLLQINPEYFLVPFQSAISILGDTNMPNSAIDFFIELLVVPYIHKVINNINDVNKQFELDGDKAGKLRDKLMSFLFSSDSSKSIKAYAFMSYLVQVSNQFLNAISGNFASQIVPIITSVIINQNSNVSIAAALVILTKIIEKNSNSIQ